MTSNSPAGTRRRRFRRTERTGVVLGHYMDAKFRRGRHLGNSPSTALSAVEDETSDLRSLTLDRQSACDIEPVHDHPLTQSVVFGNALDTPNERFDVGRGNEHPCSPLVERVAHSADIRGDDRKARSHRLDQDLRESFGQRDVHERVSLAIESEELGAKRDVAAQLGRSPTPSSSARRRIILELAPSEPDELNRFGQAASSRPPPRGGRVLLRLDAPDGQE